MRRTYAFWIVALAGLGLAGCGSGMAEQAAGREATVPVRAAAVTREAVTRPISATGTLGPKERVELAFKVGGVVAGISVDAGETVRAGQRLAALDPREIDAAVTRARSAAEKAERDLARARRLYRDSVVTLVQLQDAGTAAQVARANLEAALFDRRYASIVAPSAGVVLRRDAEPGELIQPGHTVLVLGSRARGDVVRVGLSDRDVVRVRAGDPASVRFDALPDSELEGRVVTVGASPEPGTGTYTVEIAVPHGTTGLPSGLVGSVDIRPRGSSDVWLVPVESVLEADSDHATVFALSADGHSAMKRTVAVAFLDGDRVAVTAGLDGVRRVVTDGAAYLDDGSAVRVLQ